MRAHEIIFEATQQAMQLKSREASWQDLAKALPQIQIAIQQASNGNRIYRGLSHNDDPVLFKPQMPKGTRSSANTNNTYTLFIDNNARWKDYPPRSASIIATTHDDIAQGYGTTYLVLPEGNPKIGIALANDFWRSFPRLSQVPNLYELPDVNSAISNVITQLSHTSYYRPSSWPQLQKDLHMIDQVNYLSFPNLPKNSKLDLNFAQGLLSFYPGSTMEQKLDYLLDPQANGFELTNLSSFTSGENEHEIWFSAPCWFINIDELPDNWRTGGFDLASHIQQKAAEE